MKYAASALLLLLLVGLATPGRADSQGEGLSLQARIDAAAPGAIIEVPPGVYAGPIHVARPIQLRGLVGPEGERPVLDGGGQGTVLTIAASGTVVENFVIRASGNVIDTEDGGVVVTGADDVRLIGNRLEDVLYGIRGVQAKRLQILNNTITGRALHIARRGDGIRLWQSEGCLVEGNRIEGVRDAIFWFSDDTTVRANDFVGSRYGIHMMYTDGMRIEDNLLAGNSVGAYLMYSANVEIRGNTFRGNRGPSGYGLALKDMDGVRVSGNLYEDNRVGIFFDNSPSRVDLVQPIERNVLAFNDVGILMMPAVRNNALRDNTFLDNLEQVGLKGGGSNPGESLGANGWDGNYWSDYAGYDGDQDGTGDLPYRAESLFERLTDQYPVLGILHFSPVEQAINLAARAFPIIKPKPKLTDAAPRLQPLLPDVIPPPAPAPAGLAGLALLLIVGTGLLIWRERPGHLTARALRSPRKANERQQPMATVTTPGEPMIRVRGLTKRYPQPGRPWWGDATVTAVDGVSFELAAGDAVALWGANGAGKTTVLKCLLGLLDCEGEMRLNGFDLRREGRRARRHFGYVPQELALHQDMGVAEAARFYADLKDVPARRIPELLALVGLSGQERKAIGALSGGMKQRLALALALLADPPVLLLDEPTANLDAETRDELLALLSRLHAGGTTLLFTSHHLSEVTQLADRVIVLRDGRLVEEGPAAEIAAGLARPAGPIVEPLALATTSNGNVPATAIPAGSER